MAALAPSTTEEVPVSAEIPATAAVTTKTTASYHQALVVTERNAEKIPVPAQLPTASYVTAKPVAAGRQVLIIAEQSAEQAPVQTQASVVQETAKVGSSLKEAMTISHSSAQGMTADFAPFA